MIMTIWPLAGGHAPINILLLPIFYSVPGGSSGGGSSPRGHSNRDSDTDDSLSGDYPRGWGIPKRQQSSPRDPTGELQTEKCDGQTDHRSVGR